MEKQNIVTKVKGQVKGEWLQHTIDALDVTVAELVTAIDVDHRRTIDKHLNEGTMGISYLWAIKKAYPQVNLNYLVFGEKPVLLGPNGSDAENLAAMEEAARILEKQLKK
jgi:hypothetical protein